MSNLGIDFGATKIVTAFYDPKTQKSEIILDNENCRSTSCCLTFTKNYWIFSKAAEYQANNNPENPIFGRDIKRMIGNDYEIKTVIKCEINNDTKHDLMVSYRNDQISILPEHMIAMLLSRIRENAENRLNRTFSKAVVSVPAMFNAKQRNALKTACSAAGLEVKAFLNNTTAAAVHYAVERKFSGNSKKILIFDMGATSFEVGIFEIRNNHVTTLASNGSLEIGGESFVDRLKGHFLQHMRENSIFIEYDKLLRLRDACEKVKIVLSTTNWANVKVENFHNGHPFEFKMSRERFELISQDLFEKIHQIVHETAKNVNNIEEFIVIGGGGRIPKVEETLKKALKIDHLSKVLNQDESIANGTAYYGAKSDILSVYELTSPAEIVTDSNGLTEIVTNETSSSQDFSKARIEAIKSQVENFESTAKQQKSLQVNLNSLESKCYRLKEICESTLKGISNAQNVSENDLFGKEKEFDEMCVNIIDQAQKKHTEKALEADKYFKKEFEKLCNSKKCIEKILHKSVRGYNELIEEAKNSEDLITHRFNRGRAFYYLKKWKKAVKDFNFLLDQNYDKKRLDECRFYRANSYFFMRKFDKCLKDVYHLLKQNNVNFDFKIEILILKILIATLRTCGAFTELSQNSIVFSKIDDMLNDCEFMKYLKDDNRNLMGEQFLKNATFNFFMDYYEKVLKDLDLSKHLMDNQGIEPCLLKTDVNSEVKSDIAKFWTKIAKIRKEQKFEHDLSQFEKLRAENAYEDLLQVIENIRKEHHNLPKNILNDLLRAGIEANYHHFKKVREGIQDCSMLLTDDTNDLFALRYRAKFYQDDNQKQKAENDLTKILTINPGDKEATELRESLKNSNGLFNSMWTWLNWQD